MILSALKRLMYLAAFYINGKNLMLVLGGIATRYVEKLNFKENKN